MLSLPDIFSGRDFECIFDVLSQCIIAGGAVSIFYHIGNNFDNVVNVVFENFLHCIDTVFLIVIISST